MEAIARPPPPRALSATFATYDANGNMATRNGNTIGWTSYNYPSGISTSTESVSFQYGPDRQRWQTIYMNSSGTETTYHVGKLLEKVTSGGVTDYRQRRSSLVGLGSLVRQPTL